MTRWVRYDDDGEPSAGGAAVAAVPHACLDHVTTHVERSYVGGSWVQLLDAGHDHDDELYRAWVPERIRRDFDRVSVRNRGLTVATGRR